MYKFKRIIAFILVTAFCATNTSIAVFAMVVTTIYQTGFSFKTNTSINTTGNVNSLKGGQIGGNSAKRALATFVRIHIAGAVAVNMNDLDSDAKAYEDFIN